MPEGFCGGGALFDIENDGYLDLYLVQSGTILEPNPDDRGNRLFRNQGDGTFVDITESAGVGDTSYGIGVACGDYDNDGLTDLYVTNLGPNVLYRNNGDGTFTDVTESSGTGHDGMGTSAAFVDLDRDGHLDLYFTNYLNWSVETEQDCYNARGLLDYCLPANYNAPAMDVLYRNNGDGTFTDISGQAGLTTFYGTGLGVATADFDDDGATDILVANDGMRDQLWMNRGEVGASIRLIDEAIIRGCAYDLGGVAKAGMGITVGDIDDDGDTDAIICNLQAEADSYYLNTGGFFDDFTAPSGLGSMSRRYTRFGMGWVDFNNDGRLDLYQANGRVEAHPDPVTDDPYAEENLLMTSDGQGRFREILPRGGVAEPLIATSRAAVFGDIDNDGGVDIVIVNRDGPAHVLRNIVTDRGNWVGIRVLDQHGRDAYNTRVTGEIDGRTITRDVRAAYSYLASNDPRVHFGLGEATSIRNVVVRWPNGQTSSHGELAAGAYHVIRRNDG